MILDAQPWTVLPVDVADPVCRHHPLNRGRILWWLAVPGLDGGRQWHDLLGLDHGTLTNMAAAGTGWAPTTRPGGFGALRFNNTAGATSVVPAATTPFNLASASSAITYAAWIKVSSGNSGTIIAQRSAGAPTGNTLFNWVVGFNAVNNSGTGKQSIIIRDDSGAGLTTVNGSVSLADGAWHHVALTRSAAQLISFYLDGVADGSGTDAITGAITPTGWRVGEDIGSGTAPFVGSLDDVSAWNRALSAAEVAALYRASRAGYPGALNRVNGFAYQVPSPAVATLAATAGNATAALTATFTAAATLAATAGNATAALTATFTARAVLSATAGDATASLTATFTARATLAATAGDASAALSATVAVRCDLAAAAGNAAAALTATVALRCDLAATAGNATCVLLASAAAPAMGIPFGGTLGNLGTGIPLGGGPAGTTSGAAAALYPDTVVVASIVLAASVARGTRSGMATHDREWQHLARGETPYVASFAADPGVVRVGDKLTWTATASGPLAAPITLHAEGAAEPPGAGTTGWTVSATRRS